MPPRRRIVFKCLAATAVTGAVFWFLFRDQQWADYRSVLTGMNPRYGALAGALVMVLAVARAWRIADAIGRPLSTQIIRVSLLHGFAVLVTPARLGEIALPALLNRAGLQDLSAAAGMLVFIRLLDLLFMVMIGGAAAGLTLHGHADLGGLAPWGWAASLTAAACLAAIPIFSSRLRVRTGNPSPAGSPVRTVFFRAAADAVGDCGSGQTYFRLSFVTAVILLTMIGFHYVCALAVGAAPGIVGGVMASAAAILAFALPINGIGGLGPTQAAWTFALAVQGVNWDKALIAGMLIYAVSLTVSGVLTVIAFMMPFGRAQSPGDRKDDPSPREGEPLIDGPPVSPARPAFRKKRDDE